MQREGLPPTGILATISKRAGFDSVSALLQQNPAAKRPSSPRTPPLTTPLSPRATQVPPLILPLAAAARVWDELRWIRE